MSRERGTSVTSLTSIDSRLSICSSELNRDELINKLKEYRKANIELLEDKRHLLLLSQEAHKVEAEFEKNVSEMQELRDRINVLENSSKKTAEEITTTTIKAIVRQLSNTSRKSEEQPLIELREDSLEKEEVFLGQHEDLHLPLKKMGEEITCYCGATEKLNEVVKVNHFWQKDYTVLMDECNNLKARLWKTESEMGLLRKENEELREKVLKQINEEHSHVNGTLKETTLFTLDDIEALKQQLIIYKEDYTAEKEDSKKLCEEQNKLKLELQKSYGVIDNLTMKNSNIRESYDRVNSEKEHIIKELRRLSTTTLLPLSPVSTFQRRIPSNESLDTLRTEDVIPRSRTNMQTPASFIRGNVERDGRTSPVDRQKGRTSPTPIAPSKIQRRSSPSNHIDFKDLNDINEEFTMNNNDTISKTQVDWLV